MTHQELVLTLDWYRQSRCVLARTDINEFIELVMRDDATQKPIKQAPIHVRMHQVLDSNDRCIIWAHIESGKSTTVSIARVLWEIGRNPNIRIALVSNSLRRATDIAGAIRRYIGTPGIIHEVFPDLKPAMPWSSNILTVERTTGSKDPTLQCVSVGTGGVLGARLDLVVLDDILTHDNTRTEGQRTYVKEWYMSHLAGRVVEAGRVWVVGTAFHPDDLLHALANNEQFKWVRMPIYSEGNTPHWPERWSVERIEAKRIELGPHEFARQMLCEAIDEGHSWFKSAWLRAALARGEGKKPAHSMRVIPPGYVTYTGVDLGVRTSRKSDLTVFFTIIIHPNGDREVLCIETGRWSGPEILERLVDTHHRFNSVCIVESVSAQQFIVDFAKAGSAIPVKPFETSKNKHHPEYGIEGLATELANGKWIIPSTMGSQMPASNELREWIKELLYYDPQAHSGDRLMAMWFAVMGSRMTPKKRYKAFKAETMLR